MPQGRAVFTVGVPIDEAWEFVSSMERVGRCVPGCLQARELDARHSVWQVRAELGPFSRVLDMQAESVEFDPPTHGAFIARGRELTTRGSIDLAPLADGSTQVIYTITAEAQGLGRSLMNSAIGLVIQEQALQFALNVRGALQPEAGEDPTLSP
ncbi:MAG: CoxG family protein [Chloroflexota bacterium]